MADDFTDEDQEALTRYQCPHCGKEFYAAGNKWEGGDLICPTCGAEIEG